MGNNQVPEHVARGKEGMVCMDSAGRDDEMRVCESCAFKNTIFSRDCSVQLQGERCHVSGLRDSRDVMLSTNLSLGVGFSKF